MFVLVNLKAYPCDPVAVAEAARIVADDTGSHGYAFRLTRTNIPGGGGPEPNSYAFGTAG